MKKYTLFIVYLLFFLFCQCEQEKRIINNNPEIKEEPTIPVQMQYSVDTSILVLPKIYSAIDPEMIFNVLDTIDIYSRKDEFESTEEYKNRMKQLIDNVYKKALISNLTLDSLFTIKLNGIYLNSIAKNDWLHYDADRKLMEVKIELSERAQIIPYPYPHHFNDDLNTTKGIFKNSAVLLVSYIKDDGYDYYHEIEFSNIMNYRKYFYKHNNKSLLIKFPLSVNIAKSEKENIQILATIKIIKPWYDGFGIYILRNPIHKVIFSRLEQLWIVNIKTGEIYLKIKK